MNKNKIIGISLIVISVVAVVFIICYNKYYDSNYDEIYSTSDEINETKIKRSNTKQPGTMSSETHQTNTFDGFTANNKHDRIRLLFNFLFTSDNLRKAVRNDDDIGNILQNIRTKYEQDNKIEIKEDQIDALSNKMGIGISSYYNRFTSLSDDFDKYLNCFISEFIENNHKSIFYTKIKCRSCQSKWFRLDRDSISFKRVSLWASYRFIDYLAEFLLVTRKRLGSKECDCVGKRTDASYNYVYLGDYIIFKIEHMNSKIGETWNIPLRVIADQEEKKYLEIRGVIININSPSSSKNYHVYRYNENAYYKINNNGEMEKIGNDIPSFTSQLTYLIYDRR